MTLSPKKFQTRLLKWFDQHGRQALPWQQQKTPYRVWISEIMLQQTQVSTVIPYFEKFMRLFPDVATLASAHEDKVLHLWAGLGYYSRARNIKRAAEMIMQDFGGHFPDTLLTLQTLPGIGPSTAGAIMAIAYQQQATILDGNVKRVLARLHAVRGAINESKTENLLWQLAEQYTPVQRVGDYTQAIMDLGATLCTRRRPACERCPFVGDCKAYAQGIVDELPAKKVVAKIPTKSATFLVIKYGDRILLDKRPPHGIWGGLFSLPEITGQADVAAIERYCQLELQLPALNIKPLTAFRHTFSHYHLQIYPMLLEIKKSPRQIMAADKQIWYNLKHPEDIGLPKPVQTIIRDIA